MSRSGRGTTTRRRGAPGATPSTDRRFRRTEVQTDRRRRLTRTAWRTLRWVVPVATTIALVAWAGVRIAGSDLMRIREIVVTGNDRLTASEVESLAAGLQGEHLLHVDLERYAADIRESPWVADVQLFRVLPATVEIKIRERQPIAVARHNQRLYLVDDTGIIIGEYHAAEGVFDLPVVDGLVETVDGVLRADPERASLATALLGAFESQPDLVRRFSQIDVSSARNAKVLVDDDPAWLHLGHERFAERMRQDLDLRPTLQERFGEVDYVDLRFGERVYVRGNAGGR